MSVPLDDLRRELLQDCNEQEATVALRLLVLVAGGRSIEECAETLGSMGEVSRRLAFGRGSPRGGTGNGAAVTTTADWSASHVIVAPDRSEDRPRNRRRSKLEREDDYLVATDTATGIFGVGATLADAFSDLGAALIEHRDVLEHQTQLSPGLADELRYLRQRVPL